MTESLEASIISKFSQLRTENKKREINEKNVCFICNIEKQIFDRHSKKSFEKHIDEDHNPWKYIYYLDYLKSKDSTDFTGIESFVTDLIKENNNSWFPTNNAVCLKNYLNRESATRVPEQ